MVSAQKIEDILASLRQEFIETASDQLADIERLLERLEVGEALGEDDLFSIPRNIHNIKGQGATFGFPLIGKIAHLSEDYLESAGGVRKEYLHDVRIFLDLMAKIIDDEKEPEGEDAEKILSSLPHFNVGKGYSAQKINDVKVLLAMPPGLQRKVVARELLSCGFQVIRAYDAMEAVSASIAFMPDIVMVNREFDPFDGVELAKVFSSIERLSDIHFIIFSSYEEGDEHLAETPANASIVTKRKDFSETLSELFISWGLFGEVGSEPELSPELSYEQSTMASTAPAANKRTIS
ncbi:MAG: Hpt domain-containing protein [Rhodospirillaceae bacterium]|nr:Hpt domain-containing protein [Rhodospirillaceae bacterium]MCK5546159.1 Hpt domain-containing protein [Rhodospirillaceae bacterium]